MNIFACIEIIYFLIGIYCSYYYWNKWYSQLYLDLKNKGEAQDSMAVLTLLLLCVFWPIAVVKDKLL